MAPSSPSAVAVLPAVEHVLHDVTLAVRATGAERRDLQRLLQDLSFVEGPGSAPGPPALELEVRPTTWGSAMPMGGRPIVVGPGLAGTAIARDVYVSDGSSVLHVEPEHGRATAWMAPAFLEQPPLLRQRFWAFGLLVMLRARRLYGLHAAGLVHGGDGVLLVGRSGSGKSTLTFGLLQKGWRYLSDDAVLLRAGADGVDALALRRPFSMPSEVTGRKQRVDVRAAHPDQYQPRCRPAVLLFPRIVDRPSSALRPLPRAVAVGRLLAQSGPGLFDPPSMSGQLDLLGRLVRQATSYELCAGRDLRCRPAALADLLAGSRGN